MGISAAVAQAEFFTLNFSTTAADLWQVANVTPEGYVKPTKDKDTSTTINNPDAWTKWWQDGADDPALGWIDNAKDNAKFGAVVADPSKGTGWITANNVDWVSPTTADKSKAASGYYAYKLDLYSGVDAVLEDGTLNLSYTSDDYLAAVYLNGERIYGNTQFNLTSAGELAQWTGLGTIDLGGIELSADINDLVFLIHNTNAAGSSNANATGFAVNGIFQTDVELTTDPPIEPIDPPNAPTPEPATMLIFGLGTLAAGACTAARRRRK